MKKLILIIAVLLSLVAMPVYAITDTQEKAIVDHCEEIRENLKNIQKLDARTRVYLGGYYETILTKFITPLNMRLVENTMSNPDLLDNQEQFSRTILVFRNDYTGYQQSLEDLVATNCKEAPGTFYEKLDIMRAKRKKVSRDTTKIREYITGQVNLVKKLEAGL